MFIALLLTMLAGAATVIGGLLALHPRLRQKHMLAVALAFSAGAIIYVSLVEMLPQSVQSLAGDHTAIATLGLVVGSFGLGVLLIYVTDRLIPPRNDASQPWLDATELPARKHLLRCGILTAVALSIHNFPEGLVTFVAAMQDPALGVTLAITIAVHNIPEGIAVAAPMYAATGSRLKALLATTISGASEPIGAIVGFILLRSLVPESLFGLVFALVAGMMVFLSLKELLPAAWRYRTNHLQLPQGFFAGASTMGVSLVLLNIV